MQLYCIFFYCISLTDRNHWTDPNCVLIWGRRRNWSFCQKRTCQDIKYQNRVYLHHISNLDHANFHDQFVSHGVCSEGRLRDKLGKGIL